MLVRFKSHPLHRSLFEDVADLEREIDSLFGDVLNDSPRRADSFAAVLDVAEQGHDIVVVAELPGVKKEEIKVTVHDGVLTLSGERKERALPEQARWIRNEIRGGSFSRSIELPVPVKSEAVTAELKNGILRIVLPKADEALPREIRIN
jgi:HSP20 family protein